MDTKKFNVIAAFLCVIIYAGEIHTSTTVGSITENFVPDLNTTSISVNPVIKQASNNVSSGSNESSSSFPVASHVVIATDQMTTTTIHSVTMTTDAKLTSEQTSISTARTPPTTTTLKTTTATTTIKEVITSTRAPVSTSKKPENCMKSRKDEFKSCFQSLGDNAMQYMATQNLTGFIDDMCDADRSKPYMECIKRHFQECPDFLERPEVTALQFGPYHIKDIIFFSSINQMCTCAPGLICIQELLKVKRLVNLTSYDDNNPWIKTANYKTICDYDTARYIGCVRKNLRQCQSPLTKRYGADFTNEDAEDLKLMYDFTKEHCETVNTDNFLEDYKCMKDKTNSEDFNKCVRSANTLPSASKICKLRDCVEEHIADDCDEDMIPLYIDAVNIYRHNSVRLLNTPCASATDVGVSIATVVIAICIVVLF